MPHFWQCSRTEKLKLRLSKARRSASIGQLQVWGLFSEIICTQVFLMVWAINSAHLTALVRTIQINLFFHFKIFDCLWLCLCYAPFNSIERMLFRRFWKETCPLIIYFLREVNLSTGSNGWTLRNVFAAHCSLVTVLIFMFSTKLGSLSLCFWAWRLWCCVLFLEDRAFDPWQCQKEAQEKDYEERDWNKWIKLI